MLFFLHLESPAREPLSILSQLKRLDPVGLLFFVPSMVCLILALQWGGTTDPWSAPKIIGLLVTFAVTFLAFLVVEVLMPDTAMAPTRVVLNRTVGSCMLFVMFIYAAMIVVVYYLAIWFQAAQGLSAKEAGIRTIPLVLSLVVLGILSAKVTERIGYYVPALLLSPLLCAVGCGLLSTLTPSAGKGHWIGYQVIFGFGIGCGFQNSNLGPQTVLPRADVPLGMAMMFFMQQLGGAIFLSVGQSIFSSQLLKGLSGITDLDTAAIINNGATALRTIVPSNEVDLVVNAYGHALTRTFILTAALSACMIFCALAVEWKSIKTEKKGAGQDNKAEVDVEEAKNDAKSET